MSKIRLCSADLRELADWAKASGWSWSYTGSMHLRWDHPQVPHPVFTGNTPRAPGNLKAKQKLRTALRRAEEVRS